MTEEKKVEAGKDGGNAKVEGQKEPKKAREKKQRVPGEIYSGYKLLAIDYGVNLALWESPSGKKFRIELAELKTTGDKWLVATYGTEAEARHAYEDSIKKVASVAKPVMKDPAKK